MAKATGDKLMVGLVIFGSVIGRRRRAMPTKDNKVRYVITLRVMAGEEMYSLDRWSDVQTPSDTPVVGSDIQMPVRLRTFSTKGGVAKTSLEWGPLADDNEF